MPLVAFFLQSLPAIVTRYQCTTVPQVLNNFGYGLSAQFLLMKAQSARCGRWQVTDTAARLEIARTGSSKRSG